MPGEFWGFLIWLELIGTITGYVWVLQIFPSDDFEWFFSLVVVSLTPYTY